MPSPVAHKLTDIWFSMIVDRWEPALVRCSGMLVLGLVECIFAVILLESSGTISKIQDTLTLRYTTPFKAATNRIPIARKWYEHWCMDRLLITELTNMAAAQINMKERSLWTDMNCETKNPSNRTCKTRQVESIRPVNKLRANCRRDTAIKTHFQNRGWFPESASFFSSRFQSFWIFSVKRCVSSSWSGRKSDSSRGRWAPVWKTPFIHQNVKREKKPASFFGSILVPSGTFL